MGLVVVPKGRDSNFNDLATLEIKHSKGVLETPNRLVNRHDLNAKDNIGADIPLTSISKTFMLQENIDPTKLKLLLTENGYLARILSKVKGFVERVDTSKSLVILYPHLTAEAADMLTTEQANEFVRFFADLARELNLESVALPVLGDLGYELMLVRKRNLQLIPILDLKEKTQQLSAQYEYCRKMGASDIPIIGFKFAPFPKANKGYNMVMDTLDQLHEANQATLMVDAPRVMRGKYHGLSAPHYAPFFIADMVAETYRVANWQPSPDKTEDEIEAETKQSLRLFCKNDLIVPQINSDLFRNEFDVNEEARIFNSDAKLRDLLIRMAEDRLEPLDWKQRRPFNLSRVHENVRTREEFEILKKRIESREARNYLSEKADMNEIVTTHLKERKE